MKILKNIFKIREIPLLLIIIFLILILSLFEPNFLTRINTFGILYYLSTSLIITGAMTVLFVSGGFDLSVGATLGFSGMLVGYLLKYLELPVGISILITLLVGAIIGAIIGYIVAYVEVNPLIVTLAAWFIIGSAVFIIAGGRSIIGFPKSFEMLATYKIFGIPSIILFSIIITLIFEILLRRNVFFRQNYAIGGNEIGAKLAGIRVKKVKLFNYTLVSSMAAIAGIFSASRFKAAYSSSGTDAAFQIITAVIIGGASMKGGKGTVLGSFLGLTLMALVNNMLIMFNVDPNWNKFVIGSILFLAVFIDSSINKEKVF